MYKPYKLPKINLSEILGKEDIELICNIVSGVGMGQGEANVHPKKSRTLLNILKKGRIQIYSVDSNGQKIILDTLEEGFGFGDIEYFSLGIENVYVEILEYTDLYSLNKADFREAIERYPQIASSLIKFLAECLIVTAKMIEDLDINNFEKEITDLLLDFSIVFNIHDEGQNSQTYAVPDIEKLYDEIETFCVLKPYLK